MGSPKYDLTRDFINNLRQEVLATQKSRHDFICKKFTYVISLLGLGNIKIGEFEPTILLYLAPFVAIAFDLYISGEDFSIKRIGYFFQEEVTDNCLDETKWEKYVSKNRDFFCQIAGPLLSFLVLFASSILLMSEMRNIAYWIWIGFNLLILVAEIILHKKRIKILYSKKK